MSKRDDEPWVQLATRIPKTRLARESGRKRARAWPPRRRKTPARIMLGAWSATSSIATVTGTVRPARGRALAQAGLPPGITPLRRVLVLRWTTRAAHCALRRYGRPAG